MEIQVTTCLMRMIPQVAIIWKVPEDIDMFEEYTKFSIRSNSDCTYEEYLLCNCVLNIDALVENEIRRSLPLFQPVIRNELLELVYKHNQHTFIKEK